MRILAMTGWMVCLALVGSGRANESDPLGSSESALSSCRLAVSDTDTASFSSGVATNAPPVAGQPDVCVALGVKCVEFDLKVDLPPNVWKKPGGVQVAIRWTTDDNALDLYVYRHDAQSGQDVQVGNSTGILASISGGLLLRSAKSDTYKVFVALDPVDSLDASAVFDIEARVQFDPPVKPIRPLLPDFRMLPQTTVTFDTPVFPFFGDEADPGDSCFHLERSESGAQECMRFNQTFGNIGDGVAELRFAVPKDPNNTSNNVFERTYYSDGPSHFVDSPAGNWEFHEAHQHYHYLNFVQSSLWAADRRGRRVGAAPVRAGRKMSFCMEDEKLDDALWGKSGVGPRTYIAPDCLVFVGEDANFNYLVQGLTPGWDDIYEWYLPGQYMDVAGLPNGDYILETTADPDNKIVESNESNNCTTVLVRLTSLGTAGHHADIIGKGPGCAFH